MRVDRRSLVAAAGALGATFARAGARAETPKASTPLTGRPLIVMLAYPGMFPLDLVGPEAILSGLGTHEIRQVWKSADVVKSASGLGIAPTLTFAETPDAVDMIFVPGGAIGALHIMEDPQVLSFLASRGAKAKYVTSVCTGSLVLAAAGLLRGRRATSHWIARDRLAELGATPVHARVVDDGDRITGAGVTAGLDFALTLASRLVGERRAKALQLNVEYDPQPPFHAGSPETAGPEVTAMMVEAYKPFSAAMDEVLPRVRQRLETA
jgi:cyclohexyl-isocyanide hydratase